LGDSSGLPGTRAIYASDIEGTLLSQVQLVQEKLLEVSSVVFNDLKKYIYKLQNVFRIV
jgi:hypothetical protein